MLEHQIRKVIAEKKILLYKIIIHYFLKNNFNTQTGCLTIIYPQTWGGLIGLTQMYTIININMIDSRVTVCTLKCSTSIVNLHIVHNKKNSVKKHVYVRLFDRYQIVYVYH